MEKTRKTPSRSIGRKLRTQFLAGIFILAPVGATILILVWIFTSIDNILQPLLERIFGHTITGVGFGIAIVLIYITGLIASNVGGKRLIQFGQSLLGKVPIVRPLYTNIRNILDSFTETGQAVFTGVVLVEFPRKGMRAIGFITSEYQDKSGSKLLNIYIPIAPNPASGFFQIVNEDEVIRTSISVSDGMKMVISAGKVSSPEVVASWPAPG